VVFFTLSSHRRFVLASDDKRQLAVVGPFLPLSFFSIFYFFCFDK